MNNEVFRAISTIRFARTNPDLKNFNEAKEILKKELGAIHPCFWYDLADIKEQYTIKELYRRIKGYVPLASNPIRDKEVLSELFDKVRIEEAEKGYVTSKTLEEVESAFESSFGESYLDKLPGYYLDYGSFEDFYDDWLDSQKK